MRRRGSPARATTRRRLSTITNRRASIWAKPRERSSASCNRRRIVMSKKLIWIVVIVALGIAGTLAFRSRSQPDNRIRISGNMELTQVNIAFKISGKLIERTVDEGDPVKKGQIIARLDRDQLERQRDREKAGL